MAPNTKQHFTKLHIEVPATLPTPLYFEEDHCQRLIYYSSKQILQKFLPSLKIPSGVGKDWYVALHAVLKLMFLRIVLLLMSIPTNIVIQPTTTIYMRSQV